MHSMRPRRLARSVVSKNARVSSTSYLSSISAPCSASAAARLPIGSSPGRMITTRQRDPAYVMPPPQSVGISPERTSVDLPLAAEEKIVLLRLERPQPGEGVHGMVGRRMDGAHGRTSSGLFIARTK